MTISAGLARQGEGPESIDPRNIVTIPVDTIDFSNPSDTAPGATTTTRKITVECRQTDGKSGINEEKTEYAIRRKGDTDWSEWQKENIFDNLDHNTEYEIKTKATDNAGNTQESEIRTNLSSPLILRTIRSI